MGRTAAIIAAALLLCLLAPAASAQYATNVDKWCNQTGYSSSPACSPTLTKCSTVDLYYGRNDPRYDICMIPGQNKTIYPAGLSYYPDVCNGQAGVLKVPLKNRYSTTWGTSPALGDAYIFRRYQDSATSSLLYVTVTLRGANSSGTNQQLFYQNPYPLNSPQPLNATDDDDDLRLDVSSSIYIWTDALNVTYKQYVNPMVYEGTYSCFTYVFNLKKICDPAKSYRNPATRNQNQVCTCRPGVSDCSPVDISAVPSLFIVINVNGVPYNTTILQGASSVGTCTTPDASTSPTVLSNSNGPGIITQFSVDPSICLTVPSALPPPSPPSPVPPSPTPPAPPPNLSIFATVSLMTFNSGRFFSSGYDCTMGRNATSPYYRGRTVVSKIQCSITSVYQSALDNDFDMISWTYYFTNTQNLTYFYQSVVNEDFWVDLFGALTPGCGAVGNYTDSVFNPSNAPPVPISRQYSNLSIPQPFCAFGGSYSRDGCWFTLDQYTCPSPPLPPAPPPRPPQPPNPNWPRPPPAPPSPPLPACSITVSVSNAVYPAGTSLVDACLKLSFLMTYQYSYDTTAWYCDLDSSTANYTAIYTTFANGTQAAQFFQAFQNPFAAVSALSTFNPTCKTSLLATGGASCTVSDVYWDVRNSNYPILSTTCGLAPPRPPPRSIAMPDPPRGPANAPSPPPRFPPNKAPPNSPPPPPPPPPPFSDPMILTVMSPVPFAANICSNAVQALKDKLTFFDRPYNGPVCSLGATIAYFMVITVGFTDPRHSTAFAVTFNSEFNQFAGTVAFPCGANGTIQAVSTQYTEACSNTPALCCTKPPAPPSPPLPPSPKPPKPSPPSPAPPATPQPPAEPMTPHQPSRKKPPPPSPRPPPPSPPPPPPPSPPPPPPPPKANKKKPPPPPTSPPPRFPSRPPPPVAFAQSRTFVVNVPQVLNGQAVTSNLFPTLCTNLKSGLRAIFAIYGWNQGVQYYMDDNACPQRILANGNAQFNATISMTTSAASSMTALLNDDQNFILFVTATDILCGSKVLLVKPPAQLLFTKTSINSPLALDANNVLSSCVHSIQLMRKL